MPGGVPVALQPDVHALAGAGGGAGHLSALRPPRPRPVPEGPWRPALPAQGHAGEHLARSAVTQTGRTPEQRKCCCFFLQIFQWESDIKKSTDEIDGT